MKQFRKYGKIALSREAAVYSSEKISILLWLEIYRTALTHKVYPQKLAQNAMYF